MDHIKFPNNKHCGGSALILVVVLTALLAAVGTIFLLSSRVESMSTSGIAENKALGSAIDVIVEKISNELVNDVPGVSGQEYYDYPGEEDTWLASIEPYRNVSYDPTDPGFEPSHDSKYIWPQITDLTGVLQNQEDDEMKFATRHVKVDPPGARKVILEYPEIELNDDGSWLGTGDPKVTGDSDDGINEDEYRGQLADADGDGIADAKWIKLTDVSTGKGKDIYAAIRIIDNGGMINVNTAYDFDPGVVFANNTPEKVDGTTQSNVDLAELAYSGDSIGDLNQERSDGADVYDDAYINDILRRIEAPDLTTFADFKLFDTSEELDLRSRFCVSPNYKGRLKTIWENTLDIRNNTFDSSSDDGLGDWEEEVCRDIVGFVRFDFDANDCDRRHMLTCWNMDRIINPDGERMFGIGNTDYSIFSNRQDLFKAIIKALEDTMTLATPEAISEKAAQIMVNLVDYIDTDLEMTVFSFDPNAPQQYVYGFEGPCVYISEIAVMRELIPIDPDNPQYSYAVELYNPYASADDAIQTAPGDAWYLQMVTGGGVTNIPINWSGTGKFHVMYKENSTALITTKIAGGVSQGSYPISFSAGNIISLMREVNDGASGTIPKVVDSITVPKFLFDAASISAQAYSIERDTSSHKCIKDLWSPTAKLTDTLGIINNIAPITNSDGTEIAPMQAHPANKELDCIGDIGNIFAVEAYSIPAKPNSNFDVTEDTARVNMADPVYQKLFQYLTVFDPYNDNVDNDGDGISNIDEDDLDGPEWKIAGRININTAPWFVLAQLPWVSKERDDTKPDGYDLNYELSKAIVAYRDKIEIDDDGDGTNDIDYSGDQGRYDKVHTLLYGATGTTNINEDVGFRSIGELNFVVDDTGGDLYSMWQYGLDGSDLEDYPDVMKIDTTGNGVPDAIDGAEDDFEERDVIFARISNLVTVRSDVFTAYIVVRVGVDGPQQRAIAVLDRSDVYPNPNPAPNRPNSIGKVKIRAFQMTTDIR